MQKRKGVPLIATGIIVIIIGTGLWIGGGVIDGNIEYHLESIFSHGYRNSTGTTMISAGIGIIVIGAIMSLIGIIMYAVSGKSAPALTQEAFFDNSLPLPVTRFVSSNGVYSIDFDNNGGCIWTQQGHHYKAFYRKTDNMKWMISIEGFGDAFSFTKAGDDIFVVGGPVKEKFYRDLGKTQNDFLSSGDTGTDYDHQKSHSTASAIPNSSYLTSETKQCLNCGAKNRSGANACSRCGGLYFRQSFL